MRDPYLYEGTDVLRNLLGIKDRNLLEEAESGYVTYRLKEIALNPLLGNYDYAHLLKMHKYIFQDMYDWAGQQRKQNIYKEEHVLGGLSIDYSESLAHIWKIHPFREGNTRTTITFCCQYADEVGLNPDRQLFEDNAQYVRTSLVAYNAVFDDLGDKSKPEYLVQIVEDAISRGKNK
ncbi:MAG: hypothetical protein E7279_11425 [Lachnospiraceae bacterium]|nr:hypothetical protein [Lachnospiraceae bacterium]